MVDPSEPDVLLRAEGLLVGYGGDAVAPPVDLALAPGRALGLVGANGAGKSTLLATLTGLLAPLAGSVRFAGEPVDERRADFRRDVAALLDDEAFFPSLTGREHLLLTARGHGVRDPEGVVDGEVALFGVADRIDALPSQLSSGQRRRLALAAVAAGHPARLAHVVPAIDRLLPLSATRVVVARAVVPLVLLLGVTTLTGVLLGVHSGAPVFWTAICAATAPAWAAAAVRGALRPEVDWSGPVVSTPMGVVPAGVGAGFLSGVDVGVLGSLPCAAALLLDVRVPGLVAVQLVWAVGLGAGALALVARRRNRVG